MTPSEIPVAAPTDRTELAAVRSVLARAFLDDPIWSEVGPRNRRHRRLANRISFWGITHASATHGARIRLARAGPGGEPHGATIAFEPDAWPPPERGMVWQFPWAAFVGPAPVVRGIRADTAIRASHIAHPHLYLWYIGVAPERQSGGFGRALMADLHARAAELGIPCYLETGTVANVGFYESLGYGVVGELRIPSGARLWRMERPVEAQTS